MNPAAHVQAEEAAGLASMAAGDADRERAYRHAAECPPCARLLAEGERLVVLLGAMPEAPLPSAEALARAAAPALADFEARDLPTEASWVWFVPAAVAGASWAVMLAAEKHRDNPPAVWAQSIAQLLVAIALAAMAKSLGHRALVVAALSAATASMLVVDRGESLVGFGVSCAGVELACAALPLAVTVYLARKQKLIANSASYAGVAAAGALAGHAVLHLACPAHSLGHLAIFHTGTVLLAGMIGAAVGQTRWLRAAG